MARQPGLALPERLVFAPWWHRKRPSEAPAQTESCRNGTSSSPPLQIVATPSRGRTRGGLTKIKEILRGSTLNLFPRLAILLRRDSKPAVVDQVFQPVRRHVHRDDIADPLLADGLLLALRQQHAVDFALNFVKFGCAAAGADALPQCIERIQGFLPRQRLARAQEFPGGSEHRGQPAQDHWREEDDVAPFVEETLLGAVVEGRCPRMQRNVGG